MKEWDKLKWSIIITEKFRQHNADQFFESFSEIFLLFNILLIRRKSAGFTSSTTGGSDSSPPTPSDGPPTTQNFMFWDSMIVQRGRTYLPQISLV